MTLQDHGMVLELMILLINEIVGAMEKFRMVHFAWNNSESSSSGFFKETLESHAAIYVT